MQYHVIHDRLNNPGRYVIAREAEDVRYWSDEVGDWVDYPAGTLYPSKRAAERKLEEVGTVAAASHPGREGRGHEAID